MSTDSKTKFTEKIKALENDIALYKLGLEMTETQEKAKKVQNDASTLLEKIDQEEAKLKKSVSVLRDSDKLMRSKLSKEIDDLPPRE